MNMTMVAFIRGINVGGRAKLKMADLRAVAEGLGLANVGTHLQSGNVVFVVESGTRPDDIADQLEIALAARTDVAPTVMVRTAAEMAALVEANPLVDRTDDLAQIHVVMHRGSVSIDRPADAFAPEEFAVVDRDVYLFLPKGMSGSKLVPALSRNETATGTARNWRTILKVNEMVSSL